MKLPLLVALLAALAPGCAGRGVEGPPDEGMRVAGGVARVDVAFAPPGAGRLEPDEATRTAATVRQSARDWLEHSGRLASDGDLAVAVALDSLRLRGAFSTWLLAWAVPPDHLSAHVVVSRSGRPVADFPLRVESALAGFGWRDRESRLDRLARRLGQRLAARLESGL
jgi:hypothetical protein